MKTKGLFFLLKINKKRILSDFVVNHTKTIKMN
jgi:hypothetical protein